MRAETSARGALVLAALLILAVERWMPGGRALLYPLVLFATWVHEMGHGIAALLGGGSFERLQIFGDASGLATTRVAPGVAAAVSAATGLLAPPLVGALALGLGRGPRGARAVLGGLALAMAASLALWIRAPIGWISVGGVALALGLAAWRCGPRPVVVCAQFLGLTLGLDAVRRVDYLFTAAARVGGRVQRSDVAAIADAVGGSHLAWGAAITAAGALALALGLWSAWRAPRAART
jgi:hypothetical protein